MKTLIVEREWLSAYKQTTTLRDSKGGVVAIIREHTKQPKYNTPTITLKKLSKSIEYKLDWSQIILK